MRSLQMTTFDAAIAELAEGVLAETSRLIPVAGVRFVINHRPAAIVPEIGIGGSCYEPTTVSLDVRVGFDLGAEAGRRQIRYTVAHELHHAARWRSVGYGRSLGEGIVTEGLAD